MGLLKQSVFVVLKASKNDAASYNSNMSSTDSGSEDTTSTNPTPTMRMGKRRRRSAVALTKENGRRSGRSRVLALQSLAVQVMLKPLMIRILRRLHGCGTKNETRIVQMAAFCWTL